MRRILFFSLFVSIFTILFYSCEKETVLVESTTEQNITKEGSNISYLSAAELPEIVSQLETELKNADFYNPKSGNAISSNNTSIDYNKIMEVVSRDNIKNYTFNLGTSDTKKNEFHNLIVHKKANGKLKKPFIIKYTVDDDALDTFLANNGDMGYFKGSYKFYKFTSFFNTTNLKSGDDCPGGNISGGGSGADGAFTLGDNIVLDLGALSSDINSTFGSTLNFDNTGSYIYTINDGRTGNSLSGTVTNAGLVTVTFNSGGVVVSETINVNASFTSNVTVNVNSDSGGGGCGITVTRETDGGLTIDFSGCESLGEGGPDNKSGSTNDCPSFDGEIGTLPAPIFGCGLVRTYNHVNGLCYDLPDLTNKINSWLGDRLTQSQIGFLTNADNVHDTQRIERFSRTNDTQEAKDLAIEGIEALMNGESIPKPHCSSFEYSYPPGSNYRGCAVAGVYNVFYADFGQRQITVLFDTLYFTMPLSISNGLAATRTAEAMENTFDTVEDWYAANPNALTYQVQSRVSDELVKEMGKIGGSVSTINAPFDIPNPAPFVRNLFTTGNCNP